MIDATGRPDGGAIEIIGVVDNVIGPESSEPPPPRIYRPLAGPAAGERRVCRPRVRRSGRSGAGVREALRAEDTGTSR